MHGIIEKLQEINKYKENLMGEWSDYFEDFPDENPGNYDGNGQYDPNGQLRQERLRQKTAHKKLDEVLARRGLLKKPSSNK